MTKPDKLLKLQFVENAPEDLEPDTLYVSIPFATVLHNCACGCGHEVVTPLSPSDWTMTYDGVSISLSPSIGNWNFPCRSHYVIRRNRVDWMRATREFRSKTHRIRRIVGWFRSLAGKVAQP